MTQRPDDFSFCKGRLPVAFVLSVPGTEEAHQGKPVAGDTGENLDMALVLLHKKLPTVFCSKNRYDYRITNAYNQPIAVGLGHTSSEATRAQIQCPQNVSRFIRDIEGCTVVVLCGVKAQLLLDPVIKSGNTVITVPHIGNKGLNGTFKLTGIDSAAPPTVRRKRRVAQWANRVLRKIEDGNKV